MGVPDTTGVVVLASIGAAAVCGMVGCVVGMAVWFVLAASGVSVSPLLFGGAGASLFAAAAAGFFLWAALCD